MLGDQRLDPANAPPGIEELSESEYRAATEALRPVDR